MNTHLRGWTGYSTYMIAALFFAAFIISTGSAFARRKNESAAITKRQDEIYQIAKKFYEEHYSGGAVSGAGQAQPVSGSRSRVSSVSERLLSGMDPADDFGWSSACAGDVNGDGYPDIIVGAYEYGSNTGRAYIYFGGPNMKSTPDLILTGEGTNQDFGTSVASAGDVNGDGYADVIVGANGYNSHVGRAYIYFGGPHMTGAPDVILNGEASGDNFGSTVAGAGDVNGDGYADVVVGAFGNSSSKGRAYIYFGGPTVSTTPALKLSGQSANDYFGVSVASAGDVNGDGYSDILIGASGYNSSTGRAYVFLGGKTIGTTPYLTIDGEATGDYFGNAVCSAGDVNGDGYADICVGAYGHGSAEGKVYLYYGGPDSTAAAAVTFSGEAPGSLFGYSIACAGDVNGDGYSDLVIGAPGYSSGTGRIYLYYGGKSIDGGPGDEVSGDGTNAALGISVSSAGDLNGDGFSEFMAGENGYNSHAGAEDIFTASTRGDIAPDFNLVSSGGQKLGISVADAGDVNGDGYDDIAVGGAGKVYVYFGGPHLDTTADIVLSGSDLGFGQSVAGVGDVNGDGYADLAVGDTSNTTGGKVVIYFGGKSAPLSTNFTVTGLSINHYLGEFVAPAGDVNGDGYPDIILGADFLQANAPSVLVLYGGKTMSTSSILTLSIPEYQADLILSVSSGDINKDGYSDIVVGDQYYDSNTGAAFIYYGGTSMTGDFDLQLNGHSAGELFGCAVSVGDLNGDGCADIAVGAPRYNNQLGGVFVYYGGQTVDTSAAAIIRGTNPTETLGTALSAAGDLNGDGYSDLVISSESNGGEFGAHVYYGGPSIDLQPDLTMEIPVNYFGLFGSAVVTGDFNGDGFADVIVASPPFNALIINLPGGISVYLSSPVHANPGLMDVTDVPNDQGGFVNLKFSRSGYDTGPYSKIANYIIERSMPPGATGFAWEKLATIQPNHNALYSYTASTPYDSSTNSSGTFYFRVTAQTSYQQEYWRSNIMSGHSVDNLPPAIPTEISATLGTNAVNLAWSDSVASDLMGFEIFRSTVDAVDPDSMKPVAFARTTNYTDGDPLLNSKSFYFVRAEDVHGNFSAFSVPAGITVGTTGKVVWTQTSGPYGGEIHALLVGNAGELIAGTSQGGVYRSSNSGTSWTQISSGINTLDIVSLAEDASGNLFAGSEGDGLYKSTDNGTSWTNSSTGLPAGEYVEAIKVLRNGYMVAGTYNDGLYYSKDGGKNWITSSDQGSVGSAILQDGSGRVYVGTDNGVEVSTDNGKDWSVTGLANREVLCLVQGLSGTIYAGTDEGVFVTSDSGSTWTRSGLPNLYLHAIVMDASGNLYTGSDNNGVFKSTDNGTTWSEANDSLTDEETESLAIDGSGQLYVGTYGYGVFRAYRTTGGTTGIEQSRTGVPKNYELSQNFPNPFNPATMINYQLPMNGHVTLKVYDVLGREVATLVDRDEKAGRYQVKFDGSRLSSGVYLYRLAAGKFVQIKKMVVLK
jgi:FG-GAP repeat/Secretion system C-terminal sorting domain/FG-GAP-like repeat